MKVSAMDNKFLKHTGPALVFDDYPSMQNAIYDENIDATADTVLILRNAGPKADPVCQSGVCCRYPPNL